MMPNQNDYYRSYLGTFMSLLTIIIIISYASFKFRDLLQFSDYQLLEIIQENYFTDQDTFSTDDGFHVAAGIIDLNNPYVEDPEIGIPKMFIKYWDY